MRRRALHIPSCKTISDNNRSSICPMLTYGLSLDTKGILAMLGSSVEICRKVFSLLTQARRAGAIPCGRPIDGYVQCMKGVEILCYI